jgi:hypothetical protein
MSLRYIVAAVCLYVAFYGVPEFDAAITADTNTDEASCGRADQGSA